MPVDELGRAATAVVGLLTVLALAPIAATQVWEAVRRQRAADGLQRYRLATAALVIALVELLAWRALLWLDVAITNGAVLGPTAQRWRIDLPLGVSLLALSSFVAAIFWSDRWAAARVLRQAARRRDEED